MSEELRFVRLLSEWVARMDALGYRRSEYAPTSWVVWRSKDRVE